MILRGDGGVTADCRRLVQETIKALGGVDIIIGNAGWTRFTNFADLDAMTEAEWDKCWAVNVKGQHALVKEALPTFNANPEGGVFIVTSSIAGRVVNGSSMAYAVTKSAQLHLIKCVAQTQGSKLRANAVLPGLLLTEWGNLFGEERIKTLKEMATLKKEVSGRKNEALSARPTNHGLIETVDGSRRLRGCIYHAGEKLVSDRTAHSSR